MTLPDADLPRKHRRRWLFAPYILLLLVVIVWSAAWVYLRLSAARELDQSAENLRQAGYQVSWDARGFGGYPFRLNTTLTNVRIAEPSGWGITAPELHTEAAVYALGRWTAVAPQGITLQRPQGGPVNVRGEALRASLSDMGRRPPNIAIEGAKLTFTPQPGAQPYMFSSAERLVMNIRPGPNDQAAILLKVDNASANLTGLMGRVAQGRPVSMLWESTLDHVSALKGSDWPAAVRAWMSAGGSVSVRNAGLTAGEALISAKSGALTVGPDGRLRGVLQVDLRETPPDIGDLRGISSPEQALAAVASMAGGGVVQANIGFEDGQTMLGPLPVGPAPRIY